MEKLETLTKTQFAEAKKQKRLSLTMKHDDPKALDFIEQVNMLKRQALTELKTMRAVFIDEDGTEDRHVVRWVKDGEDYLLAYANHEFKPFATVQAAVDKLGQEEALKYLNQSYSTSSDDEQFRLSGTGRISVAVKVDAAKKAQSLDMLEFLVKNGTPEETLVAMASEFGVLKEAVEKFGWDIAVA